MARLLRNVFYIRRSLLTTPESFTKAILGSSSSSQVCYFSTKGRKKSKSSDSDSNDENLSKKDIALNQAIDQITTSFGKGSIMWLGRSDTHKHVPVVSTGSISLDIALGTGGFPKGRVVEIYGPEASGKTTLALHAIAEAQKQGAALVPKGELDGEMGDAHMAMQARLMSQALRKLSHSLSMSQTTLIFINQVRAKLATFGFGMPAEVTCGGNALKFYSSVRLNIKRIGYVKKGEEIIGSEVAVKIVKNKLAPPFKTAKFELMFGKGISREAEIIDLSIEHKLVTKSGSFFRYNEKTVQGKEAFKKFLANNPDIREELFVKLKEKLLEKTQTKTESETTEAEPSEEIISTTGEETVTAAEA
ncbi:hypothetical protein ACFE04_018435 [Oxalis oulophora]